MKWPFPEISMKEYAKKNHVSYSSLRYFVKTQNKINEKNMNEFIQNQMIKVEKRNIQHALNRILKDGSHLNCKACASILKIDYLRIQKLVYLGYSRREVMFYTWFYADIQNSLGEKVLSIRKLKKILFLSPLDNQATLLDVLVKARLGDLKALEKLYELEKPFFTSICKKQLFKRKQYLYHFSLEDLVSFCYTHLDKILDKIFYTNSEQIGKFISITIRGALLNYLIKEVLNRNQSLVCTSTKKFVHQCWKKDPLQILIYQEIFEKSSQAFHQLFFEDQKVIYDLYFTHNAALDLEPILENWISGEDVCKAVERYQKQFLKIYQGE